MPELSEVGTIRRLPDGSAHPARIVNREADRLSIFLIDSLISPTDGPSGELAAGTLVEIDTPQTLFLGEILALQPDLLLSIRVEHFVDRAALAQIEKSWTA